MTEDGLRTASTQALAQRLVDEVDRLLSRCGQGRLILRLRLWPARLARR
ncbi:hypothetical protein [Streptomyces griseoluteus]